MIDPEAAAHLLEGHQLRTGGAPLHRAAGVVVALHGRGADARSILGFTDVLAQPEIAFLAPEALGGAWYPRPFTAPIHENEPFLSEALGRVQALLADLVAAGLPTSQLGVLGFSQGACLGVEAVIRHPRPLGAVAVLSGGFIGPIGVPRVPQGSLDGARVFVGCSDTDPHIPVGRVRETTALLTAMGASVTERIYPGMGHEVSHDEIVEIRRLLAAMQP